MASRKKKYMKEYVKGKYSCCEEIGNSILLLRNYTWDSEENRKHQFRKGYNMIGRRNLQ